MTTPFWLNDITILFKKDKLFNVWISQNASLEEQFNAITRLVLYLTTLGFLLTRNTKMIISALITLFIIVIAYRYQYNKYILQHTNNVLQEGFNSKEFYNVVKENYTTPTKQNPLMNVMPTDNLHNPKRNAAAPSFQSVVEEDINNKVKETLDPKLFRDLGDNLEFEQSMRNFHTMPNTKIPNDQKAFAEFCYGSMPSCKEGDSLQCEKKNYRHINQ